MPSGYIIVPSGYIIVSSGYIIVPSGYIMVPSGYIIMPSGYIHVPDVKTLDIQTNGYTDPTSKKLQRIDVKGKCHIFYVLACMSLAYMDVFPNVTHRVRLGGCFTVLPIFLPATLVYLNTR
jgi:hypothetical protein